MCNSIKRKPRSMAGQAEGASSRQYVSDAHASREAASIRDRKSSNVPVAIIRPQDALSKATFCLMTSHSSPPPTCSMKHRSPSQNPLPSQSAAPRAGVRLRRSSGRSEFCGALPDTGRAARDGERPEGRAPFVRHARRLPASPAGWLCLPSNDAPENEPGHQRPALADLAPTVSDLFAPRRR